MMRPIEKASPDVIRRILAVLDPIEAYNPVLKMATELGWRLKASGLGLILRDETVLRAFDLSLTQEVRRVPAAIVSCTRTTAEQEFRSQVRRVEAHISQLETGAPRAWHVVTAYGVTRERVVATATGGDLLVVGMGRDVETPYRRLAEALLRDGPHPVLMVPVHAPPVRSIQVIHSAETDDHSALTLASALARAYQIGSIQVLLVGDQTSDGITAVERYLSQQGLTVRIVTQRHLKLASAAWSLQERPGLLVLSRATMQREGQPLVHALRTLRWPVLVTS